MPRTVVIQTFDSSGVKTGEETLTVATRLEQDNLDQLRAQATNALTQNRAYLAIAAPTNVQVAAQVRLLTRECTALVRLALNLFDATD